MDLTGVQSPQMDWDDENLPERWKRFRQHVELMFSGPLAAKKEEEKCSYLLIWCGEKGRDIANTWSDVSDDDKKKLNTLIRILRDLRIMWNRNAIQYFPATSFTKECKQSPKR